MPRQGRKLTRKALAELYADIPPHRRKSFFRKAVALAEQCVDEASTEDIGLRDKSEALRNSVQAVVMLGDIAAKALDKHEQAARIMAAIVTNGQRQPIVVEFKLEDSQTSDETGKTRMESGGSSDSEPSKGSGNA